MGLNVNHTSECCFSRTLIDSPYGNKPDGNYFTENAYVRSLLTESEVAEEKRVSTDNEWGF